MNRFQTITMSKFAVVSFVEENDSVFVVPLLWVETKGENRFCAWPKTKNTTQIAKMAQCSLPPPKSWQRYPVRIVKKSRTYAGAIEKMKQYQICSDLETISSTDVEVQSKDRPLAPVKSSLSCCTTCVETQEYIKEILSVVNRLSNEMKDLSFLAHCQMKAHVNEEREEIDFLPVKSTVDLYNLDTQIKEEREFARLVKYLSLMGGKDEKEATRRVLSKLIDHQLAIQLTWAGSETKQAFNIFTNVLQLVAVSVRKNHSFEKCTQANVEDTIKRWLRNAADREGGRMRRKAVKSKAFFSSKNCDAEQLEPVQEFAALSSFLSPSHSNHTE